MTSSERIAVVYCYNVRNSCEPSSLTRHLISLINYIYVFVIIYHVTKVLSTKNVDNVGIPNRERIRINETVPETIKSIIDTIFHSPRCDIPDEISSYYVPTNLRNNIYVHCIQH